MNITIVTDLHLGHYPEKMEEFKNFISKLDSEILIICGDIVSALQKDMEECFKAIREVKSKESLQVLVITGNHDAWSADRQFSSIKSIKAYHKKLYKKYDIHHLHKNKYEDENVVIWGYDGWYSHHDPMTNDKLQMPQNSGVGELTPFQYLQKMEQEGLYNILDNLALEEYITTNKTKIIVTHFNVFPLDAGYEDMIGNTRVPELIDNNVDMFFYGHTHVPDSRFIGKCQYINVGADYRCVPNKANSKYCQTLSFK